MKKIPIRAFFVFGLNFLGLFNSISANSPETLEAKKLKTSIVLRLNNRALTIFKNVMINRPLLLLNTDFEIVSDRVAGRLNVSRYIISLVLIKYIFADSVFDAVTNALVSIKDYSLMVALMSSRNSENRFARNGIILAVLFGNEFLSVNSFYKALNIIRSEKKIKQ